MARELGPHPELHEVTVSAYSTERWVSGFWWVSFFSKRLLGGSVAVPHLKPRVF